MKPLELTGQVSGKLTVIGPGQIAPRKETVEMFMRVRKYYGSDRR